MSHASVPALLPGADLVEKGLSDLAAGRETIESLLVASARTRLRQLGYSVTEVAPDRPESRLYELVETEVGVARAHARYNALRRRLVSFLKATRRPVVTSRGAAPE